MTFDKFKEGFLAFLSTSNVNLGRLDSKTRAGFLDQAEAKFDEFLADLDDSDNEPKTTGGMSDRILCIKPKDKRRGLDIGNGVKSMTASESQRADEQLNRSPYSKKGNKDV